jgi:hypothetical protein
VGPLYPQVRFDQWGGTGYLLRTDGSVVRARASTQALGLLDEKTACAAPQHRAAKIVVTLNHRLNATKQWFGVISYQSATGAAAVEPDGTTVEFPKGRGTLLAALPPTSLDKVEWNLQPGSSVCVTGLEVVVPEPVGTALTIR